jgi:hypothetical protein
MLNSKSKIHTVGVYLHYNSIRKHYLQIHLNLKISTASKIIEELRLL